MTIEQYRSSDGVNITLPMNGQGLYMPQLIDDLYEAREHLLEIRTKTKYTIFQCYHLCDAIAYLNRSLSNLGIDLK